MSNNYSLLTPQLLFGNDNKIQGLDEAKFKGFFDTFVIQSILDLSGSPIADRLSEQRKYNVGRILVRANAPRSKDGAPAGASIPVFLDELPALARAPPTTTQVGDVSLAVQMIETKKHMVRAF